MNTGTRRIAYHWELVILLWLAYFLNQADRQVFNVVLPQLMSDLRLTDVQAGVAGSVFTVSLALMVLVAGRVGDRCSRNKVIIYSLLTWSAVTLLTGFSTSLLYVVAMRSITGAGEAFYAPSAHALIGQHHVESRALALSIHQTSLYTGVVVSGFIAGFIGDRFGWRAAFWSFGICGVLLAVLLVRRLQPEGTRQAASTPPIKAALRAILRTPTVYPFAIACGGVIFVNIGYLTWMPTYLHERFHLSLANAGFSSMFYHHAAAFIGALAGGKLSDRFAAVHPRIRLELQAAGLVCGAPFLYLIGISDGLVAVCAALAGFGLCRGIYDSNTYAVLFAVVDPKLHASASAIIIAFSFLLGSIAPAALGFAKQTVGLETAFSGLSLVYLASAAVAYVGARHFFDTDYHRVRKDAAAGSGHRQHA